MVTRRAKRLLLLLVITSLLGTGGWFVAWRTPVLAVAQVQIRVEGDTPLTAPVRERVAAVVSEQVRIGEPLVDVRVDGITDALEQIPQVSQVSVRRGWPSTLVVAITPRTPVAVVPGRTAGVRAAWAVVDAGGVVMAERDARPVGLIQLTTHPATVGAREALAVWLELPQQIRTRVVSIGARRSGSMDSTELVMRDGARVMWGSAEAGQRKAEVLLALLSQRALRYDVSAPDLPTTVPR